jgi:hypothetical protein
MGIIALPVHDNHWLVVVRSKLLRITVLAYTFLASLHICLLQTFYHCTEKRSQETPAPLYHLPITLSFLWLSHPPPFLSFL